MSHTPGPWKVRETPESSHQAIVIQGPRGDYVARLCEEDGTDGDARLIAAAPDLLAALREISEAWKVGGISKGQREGLARAAQIADAAIAKATGADK